MSRLPAENADVLTAAPGPGGPRSARGVRVQEPAALSRGVDWRSLLAKVGPVTALAVLVVVSGTLSRGVFFKPENLLNILRQTSFVGIIAVGMTFVIISGGIDLSVGAMLAFAGGLGVWAMNTLINAAMIVSESNLARQIHIEAPYGALRVLLARVFAATHLAGNERFGILLAVAVTLLAGMLAGLANGVLIAKGRLAPFIATLGAMAAYRSLALSLADGGEFASASKDMFGALGGGGVPLSSRLSLPYPVIVFAIFAVAGQILLSRSRFGRYVVAIGCNERAAVYSAVNIDRIKLLTYTLIGAACGAAALLEASRMQSVSSSTAGNLYELDAIAAVVIGGTRMQGGSGSVWGTVIGVLILGIIGNMLNLVGISPFLQGLVKGGIIIAAVLVQSGGRNKD